MILIHNHLKTTNIVQRRKLKTKSNPFMIDLIYGPSFKSYICQLNWSFLKGESLFGKVMYILLYFKWITNKNLLYSTWNSAQCYVAAWVGGNFRGRMDTCITPFRGIGCLILGGIFWLYRVAHGILVPGSDIEPLLPAMEAQILNHWTTKEVPAKTDFKVVAETLLHPWLLETLLHFPPS